MSRDQQLTKLGYQSPVDGPNSQLPTVQPGDPRYHIPHSLLTLGFSLTVLPLLVRSQRVYHEMIELGEQASSEALPSLSIIIPARNEASNLRRLLPTLRQQDYPGAIEIIIVDDHSTDGTGNLVESTVPDKSCASETMQPTNGVGTLARCAPSKQVRMIAAPPLPACWLGKPHASHTGALAAKGEWLLFTDADTQHAPFSAASAVTFAEARGLDGLSIFPKQAVHGLLDGAVLMVAFAGLFSGLGRSTPILNGQYILIRRSVYEQSGGFAAVRGQMMDDLAYGRLLADQGYRVSMVRGETLASVTMYDNWGQLWRGINRLGSGSLRYNGSLAMLPAVFITGVMMPVWTLLFNRRFLNEIPRLWLIWLASAAGFLNWARMFGRRRRAAPLALLTPLAAVFVQVAALWGLVSRLGGKGILWKDRRV